MALGRKTPGQDRPGEGGLDPGGNSETELSSFVGGYAGVRWGTEELTSEVLYASPVLGGSHAVGAGWHGHPEAKTRGGSCSLSFS